MKRLLQAECYKILKNWLLLGMLLVLTGFCVYVSGIRTGGFAPSTYDSVETLNQVFGKDLRTLPSLYDWQNKYEVRLIFTEMLVPIWTIFGS